MIPKFRYVYKFGNKIVTRTFTLDEIEFLATKDPLESEDTKNFRIYLLSRDLSIGLKDKNGKEIFEGDILKAEHHGGIDIVKVEWDKKYAGFEFFDKDDEPCPLTDYIDIKGFELNVEVIGNIHENPELMEMKK